MTAGWCPSCLVRRASVAVGVFPLGFLRLPARAWSRAPTAWYDGTEGHAAFTCAAQVRGQQLAVLVSRAAVRREWSVKVVLPDYRRLKAKWVCFLASGGLRTSHSRPWEVEVSIYDRILRTTGMKNHETSRAAPLLGLALAVGTRAEAPIGTKMEMTRDSICRCFSTKYQKLFEAQVCRLLGQ